VLQQQKTTNDCLLQSRKCRVLASLCKSLNLYQKSLKVMEFGFVILLFLNTGLSLLVRDSCTLCVKLSYVHWTCVDVLIKMLLWVSTVLLEYCKCGPQSLWKVFEFNSLPSTRQHLSYGEYYQNCSVLDYIDTMFTVSSTLIWAVLSGPTDWACHIRTVTPCVEVVASSCIIVTWWSGSGGIQTWSRRLNGLIVPEMTYNVLTGTLSNQPTNLEFH